MLVGLMRYHKCVDTETDMYVGQDKVHIPERNIKCVWN